MRIKQSLSRENGKKFVLWKDERKEHARTRAQLSEMQEKLELALGEVEILRKQIQREKAQFERTLVAM